MRKPSDQNSGKTSDVAAGGGDPIFDNRKSWDEFVPSWKELGAFGRSKIVNSAVLIPLLGYYILYGQEFQAYLELSQALNVGANSGYWILDWYIGIDRINLFYFGLCSIAVGAILFNFFCPPIVKDFKDYADYLARGVGVRSSHTLAYLIGEIRKRPEHLWPWYEAWIASVERDHGNMFNSDVDAETIDSIMRQRGQLLTPEIHDRTLGSAVEAALLMHYSVHSWSKFTLRVICAAFYWLGFGLVGLSAIQVFLLVTITAFA